MAALTRLRHAHNRARQYTTLADVTERTATQIATPLAPSAIAPATRAALIGDLAATGWRYRPPLGSMGAALDRSVMHWVTMATVHAFIA